MSAARFVSVHEGAEDTKIPRTTIYRWIRSKAVPSQKNSGMTLVDLEALRRVAPARRPGAASGIIGTPTGTPTGNGKVEQRPPETAAANKVGAPPDAKAALDGETQATILKRFKEGATPIDVAIETRIPLDPVSALYEQYLRARERAQPPVSPLATLVERFAVFERAFVQLQDQDLASLAGTVNGVERDFSELDKRVAQLLALLTEIRCTGCGTTGCGLWVRCPKCGQNLICTPPQG